MNTGNIPVQFWSPTDLRSLKWGSILLGVGLGLFMPRGLRRYGRWIAVGAFVFALKPLMAMLREDGAVVTSDRPLEAYEEEPATIEIDIVSANPENLDGARA